MENPGLVRALECDRRKAVLGALGIDACLDHLDLDRALRLIVRLDGAMPHPAVVMAGVDVAEEIRRGCRRLRRIDFDDDVAELGLDANANGRLRSEVIAAPEQGGDHDNEKRSTLTHDQNRYVSANWNWRLGKAAPPPVC